MNPQRILGSLIFSSVAAVTIAQTPAICPVNPNTRGQMAVFLVKTIGLRLYGP